MPARVSRVVIVDPALEAARQEQPQRLKRTERAQNRRLQRLRRWLVMPIVFAAGILSALLVQRCTAGPQLPPPMPLVLAPARATPSVAVQLSAGGIATLIRRAIADGKTPLALRDVQVGVQNGELDVTGNTLFLGQAISTTVRMQPYVEDGRLQLRLLRANLGPLPVPRDIVLLAQEPLNNQLRGLLDQQQAQVSDVQANDGVLTIDLRLTAADNGTAAAAASPDPSLSRSAQPQRVTGSLEFPAEWM